MLAARRRIRGWLVLAGLAIACRVEAPAGPPLADAVRLPAFDPAAIVEGRPPELGPLPPLRVRDHGPEGVARGERIRVRFNQPVVDVRAEVPAVELELWALPAAPEAAPRRVPAQSRWPRPDVLELEPESPLPLATTYEVVLPAGLENRDGSTLEALRWRFETPRPTLEVLPPDEPVAAREPFYVVADQPVRADVLSEHLRVRAPRAPGGEAATLPLRVRAVDWRAWPHADRYELWGYDHDAPHTGWLFAVEPERAWPRGVTGTLGVEPGLHGEHGPLPLLEAMQAEIVTRDALRLVEWSCPGRRGDACEEGPIVLRLSNELAEGAIAGIRVRPRPPGLEIRSEWDHEADVPVLAIHGDFTPGRSYAVQLPASLTDAHDQRLGRRVRVGARMLKALPEAASERPGPAMLSLSTAGGTFLRPEDARVGILGAHVKAARVRVAVLDDAARLSWLRADDLGAEPWPETGTAVELLALETHGRQAWAEHALDLARFAGLGDAVLVEVEAEDLTPGAELSAPLVPARGLFQISGLGAVVETSPARGVARITRAADGEPWPGVALRLQTHEGARALPATDADGLADLPGADIMVGGAWLWLDARGRDRLLVPLATMRWPAARGPLRGHIGTYGKGDPSDPPPGLRRGERALLAVETGRSLFLPGETIHFAGWAGIATPYGELATRRAAAGTPVLLELRHDGEQVASRRTALDEHGRFWGAIALPPSASLGDYELRARMLESSTDIDLVLADVRIPTFELAASTAHAQRILGEPNRLRIAARNLSGEPTPVERMRWSMVCREHGVSLDSYEWTFRAELDVPSPSLEREGELEVEPAAARAEVELPTHGLAPGVPHECSVSAAAQDVTLQEAGAETSFVVHPASVYIGLRTPDSEPGEPLTVEVQALDLQRRRVALSDVEVTIHRLPERLEGWRERGEPPEERTLAARCRLALGTEGEHPRCTVRRAKAGYYAIQATAVHEGAALRTDSTFSIEASDPEPSADADEPSTSADGTALRPGKRRPTELTLEAPWQTLAGEPAKIVVKAPWPDGKGLLSVAQTGLRDARPFVLRDGRATITITPRAGQGSWLELRATVARPADDGSLPRLHEAARGVHVVEPRALLVRIDAPASARPGQRVPVRLVVRDPESEEPVDARLAVWVIDDGLHALHTPYRRELASVFSPSRGGLVTLTDAYRSLLDPFSPWRSRRKAHAPEVRSAAGMVKGSLPGEVHTRFDPEPLFVGNVGTGPDGVAEVVLPLPHDLTRFRITAVASAELPEGGSGPARFGREEATVQVGAPLMVRLALPRVLRPGDEAELAALVTPPKGAEGTLEVELALEDADGRLALRGPARAVRTVRGRRTIRVPFLVHAEGPGEPKLRVHARLRPPASTEPTPASARPASARPRSTKALDVIVQRPLVVELERTAIERTAIHGRLDRDEPVAIPVRVPDGARPDHGGLSLVLRSTAVGDLDEAARYLEEYPYGCLEQTASRLLPQLALQGLADRLPAGADPAARVAESLARLVSMQHEDGTFGYWPDDPEAAAFAGAYATWVMQLAAEAGQPVPTTALAKALDAIAAGLSAPLPTTSEARDLRRAERALAVHVLVRAGRETEPAVAAVLDDLHEHRDALPLFARAWLLMALHDADMRDSRTGDVERGISTAIERQPGSARLLDTASDRYDVLFDSDARTHALVLMAWLQLHPDDPVVDELAHGLRLRRSGGRWRNTQENAYALLALSAHAREREAVAPDHRIDAWVGARRLEAIEQHGRDPAPRERTVTMAELLGPLGSDRTATVVLDREGEGAAYWRLGMEWAAAGPAPARSQGLSLGRRLLDADGEPVDPRSLRAGRRYLLELVLDTEVPQPYVAVELPLPAGLEAIDASLGAGGRARVAMPGDSTEDPWVDHQELHRDRVLVFVDELGSGRHVHTIPVLATTPGSYVLPAAVAEAMYSPEIRARTTATRVRVGPSR